MPDHFTEGQIQQISAALFDLCKKNSIPFFVFSFGAPGKDGKKEVITFTGQPDPEVKNLYQVEISVDSYE